MTEDIVLQRRRRGRGRRKKRRRKRRGRSRRRRSRKKRKRRRRRRKRGREEERCSMYTQDTFSTSSSKAHCTPSLVLALASMNSIWCLRANFKPSSLDTSRFSWNTSHGNQASFILHTWLCVRPILVGGKGRWGGGGVVLFFCVYFLKDTYALPCDSIFPCLHKYASR